MLAAVATLRVDMEQPGRKAGDRSGSHFPEIVELNVGGKVYFTRHATLVSVPGSLLWTMFGQKTPAELSTDSQGRYFIDRDGVLFRYILDYLRDSKMVLPDYFRETASLQKEADYFQLHDLSARLRTRIRKESSVSEDACGTEPGEAALVGGLAGASIAASPGGGGGGGGGNSRGFITIGYRGSYTIGRDIQTDHKFRRVARITVCGKTSLAKEVFGETLNESRDPDRPPERYTSRYYLKYNFLEQAFDRLAEVGFRMVACSSTGTCAYTSNDPNEDKIWTSYTEYVFCRDRSEVQPPF